MRWSLSTGILLIALGTVHPQAAFGEYGRTPDSSVDPQIMSIDESKHLGATIPGDPVLLDETGNRFRLRETRGMPLILLFSYYRCDGSCPTLNAGLVKALQDVDRFQVGEDYQVLTVSFDKHDTPEQTRHFVHKLNLPQSLHRGWRHAVTEDTADIERLTATAGYKYFWSARDRVFLHPNALVFVSPEGRIVRYLYGLNFGARDIELALIDAQWNKIVESSGVIDILVGVCYSYNFQEGRYTLNYALFIGVAALLLGISSVVLSLTVFKKKILRGMGHA